LIAPKFVDLYARNAGLRDKLIAERDVVLTYALRALLDEGMMDHLAFKGGTCLRKIFFGSSGRFSEDLDFTIASELSEDDVLVRLVEVFNRVHHGVAFTLGFAQLEFEPFAVRALVPIEVIGVLLRTSQQSLRLG
jgi:predicted nucleotidyltransferase component of viral defense system